MRDDRAMEPCKAELAQPGHTIAGRYVIEGVLGSGGMGAVYRVLDTNTGRRCALKRARAREGGSIERRQRLLEREYYTLAQLAHPRIIAVYDYGVDADGPYYTMELLDGADLSSLGAVPWPEVCAILRDVASSLAILHSRGLLHRDVSAHNVRYAAGGAAKLIDFGGLCSVGVDVDVVGTPPYIAPEALQMQALDARCDLYALGALGYWLLTGRHAYPARQISVLRDQWRSQPAPPARLVPDVPPALSALVMSLLTLDRNSRPGSAPEVMRHVCTIAQLPVDEEIAVSHAYLFAPTLVAREAALLGARKQLLGLVRGDGRALLIEGVPGSGRSRMLDACVLEGKLLGARVVRAHAVDSAAGDWGVARVLLRQLLEQDPPAAAQSARLGLRDVRCVLDGTPLPAASERSALIRELRDLLLELCAEQRTLLVVDDVGVIDQASLAWLASVANKLERRALGLVLATDLQVRVEHSASLRLLRDVATRIELQPFSASETEALMRSVFGDVPNLQLVAAYVHRLAQGNANASMELAQHLVRRGLCRYEAGTWSLAAKLSEGELPSSLAESLEVRLDALSADAHALCEVASIASGPALHFESFTHLAGGWAHELVTARVLLVEREHYHFSHRGFSSVASARLRDPRRRELHGRMADWLASESGDSLQLLHHLLGAERDLDAIALLGRLDANRHHPPTSLLERALERAEHRGLPVRVIADLRLQLVSTAALIVDSPTFMRHLPRVLERLVHDSGLGLYQELCVKAPAGDAAGRLMQALGAAQAAFAATPEADRGYPVDEAIRKLMRLSNGFSAIGMRASDANFFEVFPAIEPLRPLSAAIGVMSELLGCARDVVAGRFRRARTGYESVLARLEQPDNAGFDAVQHTLVRHTTQLLLAAMEAPSGIATCEERLRALEDQRAFRVAAWRTRQQFQLSLGNIEQAKRCMRRAEVLQLQDAMEQSSNGTAEQGMLFSYVRAEDVSGIQSMLDAMQRIDAPGFVQRMLIRVGQSTCLRLRGDPRAALALIEPALAEARPGQHWCFAQLALAHLQTLLDLDQLDAAIEHGRRYVRLATELELTTALEAKRLLGLALARAGEPQAGLMEIEALIRDQELASYSGVALGQAYEAAARVCILMRDRPRFEAYARRCADAYKPGRSSSLNARLARLKAEAEPAGLAIELALPTDVERAASVYESVCSRIVECVDRPDRTQCALSLLLEHAERAAGVMFGIGSDKQLVQLASLPERGSEAELSSWITTWVAERLAFEASLVAAAETVTASDIEETCTMTEDTATRTMTAGIDALGSRRYSDAQGREFEAVLLTTEHTGHLLAVAVLVLQLLPDRPRTVPDRRLLREIAGLLHQHGDVEGVTLNAPVQGKAS
jgi:tRNA A-37 threonylcarbamoyl transferase component Bud32